MKYVWILPDYKQAEPHVVAWRGPVPKLKEWFRTGQDVHTNVTRLIAKTVQEGKIQMPRGLFMSKPWETYNNDDDERNIGKQCVNGNNYQLGKMKFAQLTGLPIKHAEIVQGVYHNLFPEIRKGYHKWIQDCLRKTRTIWTPLGRRRIYYGNLDDDTFREAYSLYAQDTVGDLLVNLFNQLCELFINERVDATAIWTPQHIRQRGLDVKLQVHDSLGVAVPDDPSTIEWVVQKIKELGEIPIEIAGDILIIPIDFKIGYNFGEVKSYLSRKEDTKHGLQTSSKS